MSGESETADEWAVCWEFARNVKMTDRERGAFWRGANAHREGLSQVQPEAKGVAIAREVARVATTLPADPGERRALTEAEWALIRSKAPEADDTGGWEWALLRRTIDAVLAARTGGGF